ncbi:MFS transporter [Nocardioides jiangxiensis]|uniref:MFS transporter n=1 Tax=Nocardioides jiangxiensis TaxID=3064524 RepID=A0ABT9B4Y6_9ACTN|nr:MFS transporter [Nocardioides sp. WY-20]MDO7868667.1 MFS transporter [Nocardioides sp. WY-20]
MSPTFRALSNPNYRRYAAGGVVSNTGTWMQRVAQDWLVLAVSGGSGTAIGVTTGLQFLPFLLVMPFAGVVADRVPKRRLLQVTNVAMAAPALVLGLLAVSGHVETWHVYVLALLLGVGSAFDAPARQSFVSELVLPEDLPNAVGLNSASFNAARLVGPGLAGLLIAWLGGGAEATGWVILLNAATYAAPVWSLARLDEEHLVPAKPAGRGPGALREAVRYVRGRRDLVVVLAIVFVAGTFGLNFQLTSALMATNVFGRGPGEYGLLGSVLALGSLTGALVAARRETPRPRLIVAGAIVFGVLEVAAGSAPSYLLFALAAPLLGFSALTMITAANGYLQVTTEAGMRGRVMALYLTVFMGGTPFGSPLIGWVGEAFGPRWTLWLGGGVTALGALVAHLLLGRPRGRRMNVRGAAALPQSERAEAVLPS